MQLTVLAAGSENRSGLVKDEGACLIRTLATFFASSYIIYPSLTSFLERQKSFSSPAARTVHPTFLSCINCVSRDIDGEEWKLGDESILAANPKLHEKILQLIHT